MQINHVVFTRLRAHRLPVLFCVVTFDSAGSIQVRSQRKGVSPKVKGHIKWCKVARGP